jgi:hypothetical protein
MFSVGNVLRTCRLSTFKLKFSIHVALGIVADSPEAWELASMPRTMSGKPDGELASRNAQEKIKIKIENQVILISWSHNYCSYKL